VVGAIAVCEPDEQQKAPADFPGSTITDSDFGARDALKQYAQGLLDRD
jgi:hypothetical protein